MVKSKITARLSSISGSVVLTQTDTTVGFISQNSKKLYEIKSRKETKPFITVLSDTIIVVASNESGCSDEEQIFVEMKEPPNAFTPNGDGKNDIFLEGHDIVVFSSWGGEIFKGNTGWDGKHNGSLVVPGTYYYIHHIYSSDGVVVKTLKGSVTVVIE